MYVKKWYGHSMTYIITDFKVQIYDKQKVIWCFPYHTPYQPSTHIRHSSKSSRVDIGVLGWFGVWHGKPHIILYISQMVCKVYNPDIYNGFAFIEKFQQIFIGNFSLASFFATRRKSVINDCDTHSSQFLKADDI